MTDLMNRFRVDGAVAVITGGGNGIGAVTADLFAAAGARVVIFDKDRQAATKRAQMVGKGAVGVELDVSDEEAVDNGFAQVATDHGRVDLLVNNAGTAIRRPTLELSLADWNKVVGVNMTGAFLCARAAARHMPAGGGAIVNSASIMGVSGGGIYPNISYQATKGALVNMTRALAVEWAERQIRVNAVAPTWTRTEFIRPLLEDADITRRMEAMTPLGRLAEPEEVATAILFLASPAAAMITGHILAVDGGFLAQ